MPHPCRFFSPGDVFGVPVAGGTAADVLTGDLLAGTTGSSMQYLQVGLGAGSLVLTFGWECCARAQGNMLGVPVADGTAASVLNRDVLACVTGVSMQCESDITLTNG